MKISVIICTYNRVRLLENSLRSLESLNIPHSIQWELLIIDNNSSDLTSQLVQYFLDRKILPLRYMHEANQGLSHARNRGVIESKGDVIAFIDDDVIVPVDWLIQVHRAFTLYDVDVISGKVILNFEDVLPAWLDNEFEHCFGAFDRGDQVAIFTNPNDGMVGIGANICFRRKVFQRIGLFDIATGRHGDKLLMGEETELIRRVLINGGKCTYFPDMYIYHIAGSEKVSKKYVLQWHYRFGQWEAQCNNYQNLTLMQTVRFLCWSLKRLMYESTHYLLSFLSKENGNSRFNYKVKVAKNVGYILNIFDFKKLNRKQSC